MGTPEVADAVLILEDFLDFGEIPSKFKLISNLELKSNLMIYIFFYFQLNLEHRPRLQLLFPRPLPILPHLVSVKAGKSLEEKRWRREKTVVGRKRRQGSKG